MKKYFSKLAAAQTPYTPGEQPKIDNLIKLNTNENPYPPSHHVIEAIEKEFGASLRLYPDPTTSRLNEALAKRFDVNPENIFTGNGSDEVLSMCFMAFFDNDRPIKMYNISYSFYDVYAKLYNIDVDYVNLKEDFTAPVEQLFDSKGGVLIANPNAPTGIELPTSDIIRIIENNKDKVVIVDEAYVEFGGTTCIPLTKKYDNLLVVRTMSKAQSLAGLRVGYAVGSPELIDALFTIKNSINSYTLNRLSIAAAAAATEDQEYFDKINKQVADTRDYFTDKLRELGFTVLPSKTNFVFTKLNGTDGQKIMDHLRSNKILVRYFSRDEIKDYVRISIGTKEDMDTCIEVLKQLL